MWYPKVRYNILFTTVPTPWSFYMGLHFTTNMEPLFVKLFDKFTVKSKFMQQCITLWTAMLWKSHENVIKNPGKHFSGPWIQIFHFHGLFFRPWIFYEKWIMGFMAHEFAMKYLALGFMKSWCVIDSMGHENYTQRLQGSWKMRNDNSISWVINIHLNMCHVEPWNQIHWFHGPWKF